MNDSRLFEVQPMLTPADLALPPEEIPEFDAAKHRYSLDGTHLPGVTTILGVLDKPALPWWGMTIGVKGVLELLAASKLSFEEDGTFWSGGNGPLDDAGVVNLLTQNKLTVNHVKDAAGARGSVAHDWAENYVKYGVAPDLSTIPEAAKPYVQSAAAYFIEMEPESLATEVMVWSERYWYAGTFDKLARIDGRLALLDYKTSKRAYDTHLLQLGFYEAARRELGLDPVELMGVVHISNEGAFDRDRHFFEIKGLEISRTIEDAMAVLKTYTHMKRREDRLKALHKRMNPKGR